MKKRFDREPVYTDFHNGVPKGSHFVCLSGF